VATVIASLGAFLLVRVALSLLAHPPSAADSARAFHRCAQFVVLAGALTTALSVGLLGYTTRRPARAKPAPVESPDARSDGGARPALSSRRRSTPQQLLQGVSEFGAWLGKRLFWHVGLLYTCARLSVNLTATYMPLLLLETCKRTVDEVASVPILMYLFQIVGAIGAERLSQRTGKPRALLMAAFLSAASSLALRLLPAHAWPRILAAVCAQSLASSGVLVLVVAMQADAARKFPGFGHGFLYGTHSMLDKLSSGAAIVLLQRAAQVSAGEAGTSANGMARPGGAAAERAFIVGACVVPCCAALVTCALCLQDALAPLPPPNPEAADSRRACCALRTDEHLEQDALGHPLLTARP
jgi:Na+/melibiose symporter-like transporter